MTRGEKSGRAAIALAGFLMLGGAWAAAQPPAAPAPQRFQPPPPMQRVPLPPPRPATAPQSEPVSTEEPPPVPAPTEAAAPEVAPETAPESKAAAAPAVAPEQREASPPPVRISSTQLNMVRTAPEQIGQVPNSFFWIRPGLQAVQDPGDGALVFLTDEGRIAGRAALPSGFVINETVLEEGQILLIVGSRRQIAVSRSVDPATVNAFTETSPAPNGATRSAMLTRRGPQQLILNDTRRAGARALDVRSIAGGRLAQAYEVSPGTGDNRYIVTEEIVGTQPALQVRVFVQRYDGAGKLTGVAHVPLDGMDAVPRDFIAVTGDGVVRVLVPENSGIKISDFEFSLPPRGARRLNDDELKSLGRSLRQTPVDSNVTGGARTHFRGETPRLELKVPTPPIKRETVLANARAYLTVNWVMQTENFSRLGVESACEPGTARIWLRPRRFTKDMIGTTIGPMPYRWGGEDTPATYKIRTEWGALAGNICTCRDPQLNYCIFADSAGVDCSGLISRAWGIEKRGTSGLLDVATEVDSIEALKPGDAFDWPQRHVRLFTGMAPGAATAFAVLESSTRLECEGVCARTLRPSEVNGYRMIRYRGITENGAAVAQNNGAPGQASGTPAQTSAAKPAQTKKLAAVPRARAREARR
jgi:hypothetical protein